VINLQPERANYIPGIDGLRAIAVLTVMLFHLDGLLLPGGFSGVDVFFVISGYVVAGSLNGHAKQKFSTFIIDFYRRRIIRIFPVLLVVLLISILVTVLFLPKLALSRSFAYTGLAAFFGGSNFLLAASTETYFSPSVEFNPFVHTWSLAVEEQFYVLFPIMYFIWSRHLITRSKSLIFNLVFFTALASFVFSWYESTYYPSQAYYHLTSRFWELAVGALLFKYHAVTLRKQNNVSLINLMFICGFLLMGVGFFFADKTSFPFPWAIPSVVGTALVIHSLVIKDTLSLNLGRWLEINAIRYVGKLSYSLYLWHWPIYVFFRWTIGLETWQECLSAACLTFLLAAMSYHLVERKFSSFKLIESARSGVVVVIGVITISLSFGLGGVMFMAQNRISLSVTSNIDVWSPYIYHYDTKTGNEYAGKTLFVIGDSHAGAYGKMFKMLEEKTGIKVKVYSKGGCGILNLRSPGLVGDGSCKQNLSNWLSEIEKEIKDTDILFFSSLKMPRMSDHNSLFADDIQTVLAENTTIQAMELRKEALQESLLVLKRFNKVTNNIIIDAPKPVFPYQTARCADWYSKNNSICANGPFNRRDHVDALSQLASKQIASIQNQFPQVRWWHTIDDLCDERICNVYHRGKPLYIDGDHLSGYGNEYLYPSFASLIAQSID